MTTLVSVVVFNHSMGFMIAKAFEITLELARLGARYVVRARD
ncbi:hypothetical protein [Bradyrhizobium sp. USDA 3397]